MLDDGVLIGRIRTGDLQAFGELYHKYRRSVFHTALAITRDRIAVNLSYTWVARRRPWLVSLEEALDHLVAAPRVSPERLAEWGEVRRAVQEAIDGLSFNHRVVVILYFLQGFSLAEIAYILDCPEGTVKSRLHYACKTLRARLSRDYRLAPNVGLEFS